MKNILKTRNSGNEELCHRIGMGLALDAASAHHGVEVLHKHFEEAIPAVPEEHAAQLGKTGLPKLLEALRSESGKKFVGCLTVLNVGKSGQPAESDVKDAVKTFVAYLQDPKGTLHRNLTRLATDAAALYLFAMTLLKDMALVQSPEGWAEKVEGKQSDAVKAWKRKPADEKKLRQALVAELMVKVENNEPAPGKKRRVSDSSSAASSGTGSSKGGTSSEEASGEDSDGSAGSGSNASSGKASKTRSSSSSSLAPKKDNNKKKDKKKDNKKDKKKDTKEKKPNEKKDTKGNKEEKDKKNNKEDKKIEAKEKKNPKEKEANTKERRSKKPSKSGKEKKAKGDTVALDSEADVIESSSQNEEKHDKDKKGKKAEQKQKEKELQAEKRRERKEAERATAAAAEAAEEARAAAFTTWPSATVQEAADQLEDAKASIGLLTGRFKKEDLVNLTRLIPAQVLAQFPEVCVAIMLCPCCFPKRFKNLVFSRVFVHAAFMLCPCCFPKRFKNLVFSQVFVHVALM